MELKIMPYEKAAPIQWNFEEIKTELKEKIEVYKTLQYTEDQIAAAKTDRAGLNSLKKALIEERIRREKEFMEPFSLFKAQVSELVTLIEEPVKIIDSQIKEYEEREKAEKRDACMMLFHGMEGVPEWLNFQQIENPKWANKTASMKSISEEITEKVRKINADIALISELPEYSFEALECYKMSLDVGGAIAEGKRLADVQRRKEEAARAEKERQERMAQAATETAQIQTVEAKIIENTTEAVGPKEIFKMTVRFECELSIEEAMALKEFLRNHKITYRQI